MNVVVQQIQTLLGVKSDGIWGPITQAALDALTKSFIQYAGKASSFADPRDVAIFERCKASGKSDEECFAVGDNGIGCWGDSTVEGTGNSCAVPPEYMEEKFGSIKAARMQVVEVSANDRKILCHVKDRMPFKAHITNEAVIDLNPDAVRALGLEPPILIPASWRWV